MTDAMRSVMGINACDIGVKLNDDPTKVVGCSGMQLIADAKPGGQE